MKLVTVIFMTVFISGCAEPVSDGQVRAVAAICEKYGKEVEVFNGLTSYVKCKEVGTVLNYGN